MNVYELYAKLFLDTGEYEEQVDKAESDGHRLGEGLGKALKAGAKVATAAMGAAYTAVSALTKSAVGEFAQYEQLTGGVEKLFGNSSRVIQIYAQNAYKTAGMSANEYMETVTGFSASLISSLGGDTAAAARVADRAIRDMSDNANVFGSDMATVQSAYQGFAKQNYTLLDNLKLGYGGTQEEMKRLIKDASEMSDVMDELGVSVDADSMSFDNIVNAISVVQKSMDITGTTSKEAAGTIEGSTNMMKAAWKNLLTGIASGDKDLNFLMDDLINSAGALASNLVPRISQTLESLGSVLEGVAPMIATEFPNVVGKLFPVLTKTAVSLLKSLGTAMVSSVPMLASYLFSTAMQIVSFLSSGVQTGIPAFLSNVLPLLLSFSEMLRSNAGTLISAGLELLLNIVKGIMNSLPVLIAYVPQIIENIAGIINDNAPKLFATGFQIIVAIVEGIINAVPAVLENIVNIGNAIIAVWNAINWINLGKTVVTGIVNIVKTLPGTLKKIITQAVNGIKTGFTGAGIPGVVNTVFTAVKTNISNLINGAVNVVKNGVSILKNAFKFSWSLPRISLPHFSVSGGQAPWGFGGQGSLPHISVSWYKKAYDNALLFQEPTVLYDGMKGRGFGDGAGGEMVVGEDYLMDKIRKAQGNNNGIDFVRLIALLEKIYQAIKDGHVILLDGDTFVGKTANKYNQVLGKMAIAEGMGW